MISNYKFVLCFENTVYPGYITEKIIDCFVAGTVPIYLGAPDIEKYIPKDAFIDMRDFDSFAELDNYLNNLPEDKALKIINSGKKFLAGDEGKKYSFDYFAELVISLIKKDAKNEIYS